MADSTLMPAPPSLSLDRGADGVGRRASCRWPAGRASAATSATAASTCVRAARLGRLDLGGGGRRFSAMRAFTSASRAVRSASSVARAASTRFCASARTAATWASYSATSARADARQRLGRLEVALDRSYRASIPSRTLRNRKNRIAQREHDEGAEAPDEFFDFGEDRVEVALGTVSSSVLVPSSSAACRAPRRGSRCDGGPGGCDDGCQHVSSLRIDDVG